MLVFAIVGGFADDRDAVAAQFSKLMGATGVVATIPQIEDDQQRLDLIKAQYAPRKLSATRMLIVGLRTVDEITWLKSIGGYVVHIDGRFSDCIRMTDDDFYVTPELQPRGRFDTVEQCYSAMSLRYRNHAKRLA